MRRVRQANIALSLLAIAAFTVAPTRADAQVEQVKPYVLLILDISGSMDGATGNGAPSCGGADTKFNHAKCAISNLVNTHGDITFGLAAFRKNQSGSCGNCNGGGINCSPCNESNGSGCTAVMSSADRFQLLVPLIDDSFDFVLPWLDNSCGTCGFDASTNPELSTTGWTPIGGSLRGAQRYFQGNDPNYAGELQSIYGAGPSSPINQDPLKDVDGIDGNQCRPYIVIMLTDGAETCEQFTGTTGAAAALLATPFGGDSYYIETKPIGFGISPGNSQIEGLAHAGGEPDGPGNEGFYAANEEELSIAFNQIIVDSLKVEICNNLDDDCDGEIDEGFVKYCDEDNGIMTASLCTPVVDDCDNDDDNCVLGTSDETPKNACGTCGALSEDCNLLDDDCDMLIDEGGVCNGCTPTGPEVCDNSDNDCDGSVDEGLTRACGTDVGECVAGEEQCIAGNWENCDATGGSTETCDGLDNDCDGIIDGFAQQCNEIPGNGPPFDGVCQPGTEVCPTDGSGMFGACLGEVGPSAEVCDLLDNDCDGTVDEDTGGADCSDACGMGLTECNMGVLECVGDSNPVPETCNGFDDDCDSKVDEGMAPMGPCDEGGTLCVPGELQCVGGSYQCVGGSPGETEICDCDDNDCDNQVDEGTLCATGASCVDCQCAFPCDDGEFPCPLGKICENDFCVVDPCFDVDCPPDNGEAQTCDDGVCVAACSLQTCNGGFVCRTTDGTCQPDNCIGFPDRCSEMEFCVGGVCELNECFGVNCAAGEVCTDGDCVGTCAGVNCPDGQECFQGECRDSACTEECADGQVCNSDTGECQNDPCRFVMCSVGETCDPNTGDCERDPCLGVECPDSLICAGGSCYDPSQVDPDGNPIDNDYVGAGGGGGCAVSDSGGGSALLLLLALFGLATVRRREER